ncbi:hypothetical protein [Rhodococcus sp. IEGM 1408]|uniref:hypothetical protein n=1 Tax=Rhodococcus sp. IEGM 1408 TaxID=3082220 RepID=UPI002954DA85|nr:hypothetical protein [Rhodococcus sp. IEGM 1408]MDV8003054.1 hypothetical protein [Rhodococcus sp. IEGM 1408]
MATLFLVSACGGSNRNPEGSGGSGGDSLIQSAPVAPPAAAGPGIYTFGYEGAAGSILVPTPATDPRLIEIESYRKLAGAAPATYFIADVNNMAGTETLNMYRAIVTTDTGAQFEASNIGHLVDEWREAFSVDNAEDREKYNIGVNLNNDNMFYLKPGAKGTAILAAEGELDGSPSRVYVSPQGAMAEVEATKAAG